MSLFPRLRQACGEATKPGLDAPTDEPLVSDPDVGQVVNRAVLSGVMVSEPLRDRSRDGDAITVLQLSFPAPDEWVSSGSALCEVEVLDEIADRHRGQLRLGATVLVVGELTGAGGIWANFLIVKTAKRSAG